MKNSTVYILGVKKVGDGRVRSQVIVLTNKVQHLVDVHDGLYSFEFLHTVHVWVSQYLPFGEITHFVVLSHRQQNRLTNIFMFLLHDFFNDTHNERPVRHFLEYLCDGKVGESPRL